MSSSTKGMFILTEQLSSISINADFNVKGRLRDFKQLLFQSGLATAGNAASCSYSLFSLEVQPRVQLLETMEFSSGSNNSLNQWWDSVQSERGSKCNSAHGGSFFVPNSNCSSLLSVWDLDCNCLGAPSLRIQISSGLQVVWDFGRSTLAVSTTEIRLFRGSHNLSTQTTTPLSQERQKRRKIMALPIRGFLDFRTPPSASHPHSAVLSVQAPNEVDLDSIWNSRHGHIQNYLEGDFSFEFGTFLMVYRLDCHDPDGYSYTPWVDERVGSLLDPTSSIEPAHVLSEEEHNKKWEALFDTMHDEVIRAFEQEGQSRVPFGTQRDFPVYSGEYQNGVFTNVSLEANSVPSERITDNDRPPPTPSILSLWESMRGYVVADHTATVPIHTIEYGSYMRFQNNQRCILMLDRTRAGFKFSPYD